MTERDVQVEAQIRDVLLRSDRGKQDTPLLRTPIYDWVLKEETALLAKLEREHGWAGMDMQAFVQTHFENDDALMQRVSDSGDSKAYIRLCERWHAYLQQDCQRKDAQGIETSDAISQAFTEIWEKRERFYSNFAKWVQTLVKRRRRDIYRHESVLANSQKVYAERRSPGADSVPPDFAMMTDEQILRIANAIVDSLAEFADQARAIIVELYYASGSPVSECPKLRRLVARCTAQSLPQLRHSLKQHKVHRRALAYSFDCPSREGRDVAADFHVSPSTVSRIRLSHVKNTHLKLTDRGDR